MTSIKNSTKLSGRAAIEYAQANGLTLSKYADPTEDAREGLSVDEAREIAAEDPELIYLEMDNDSEGHVVIGEDTYYLATELEAAKEAMRAAGLSRLPVYRGEGQDEIKTSQVLFA